MVSLFSRVMLRWLVVGVLLVLAACTARAATPTPVIPPPTPTATPTPAPTPGEAPLTWPRPALDNAQIIRLDAMPGTVRMDTNRDYLIVMPAVPVVRGFVLSGGRNVMLIGGEISIPWQGNNPSINSRRALAIYDATGIVHIEGLRIGGPDLSEGIQVDAPLAIVQLQNIYVDYVHARDQVNFTDNHPDIVQTWGSVKELRIDRLTGSTDYQGFFLCANYNPPHGPVHLRRVNIIGRETARFLVWFCDRPAGGDVTLDEVWIDVHPKRNGGLRNSVWPQSATLTVVDNIQQAAWPAISNPRVSGIIRVGTPPSGDYGASAGLSYQREAGIVDLLAPEREAWMSQENIALITGLVGLLLGSVLGGGTALVVVARIFEKAKNDPNAIALGEKLYSAVPLPVVQQLLRDAAVYAGKVTDGVPEAEKMLTPPGQDVG